MLQYRAPLAQLEDSGSTDDARPLPADPSLGEHLGTVFRLIRRQLLVIFSVIPLTVGLAVVYLYTTPPRYTAEAQNRNRYWKGSGLKPTSLRRKSGYRGYC